MKKLHSLRAHLINRIIGLNKDPDRLLTFIEGGKIEFHRGQSLSHQYTVPARIVLTDYTGEIDAIMLPLLQWLSHYEPSTDPKEAIQFEAEILSNHAMDISIQVTLTERVVAKVDCENGRIDLDHRMPEFPIDPCSPDRWQVYMRDTEAEEEHTLIAEWDETPAP